MKRSVAIGIGILIFVAIGIILSNGISGNVVLGSTVHDSNYENEYFKIDSGEVGVELNDEVINGTEDFGGSR